MLTCLLKSLSKQRGQLQLYAYLQEFFTHTCSCWWVVVQCIDLLVAYQMVLLLLLSFSNSYDCDPIAAIYVNSEIAGPWFHDGLRARVQ